MTLEDLRAFVEEGEGANISDDAVVYAELEKLRPGRRDAKVSNVPGKVVVYYDESFGGKHGTCGAPRLTGSLDDIRSLYSIHDVEKPETMFTDARMALVEFLSDLEDARAPL